ncbi:hypothetical protein [Thermoleptolyngbya sp.]
MLILRSPTDLYRVYIEICIKLLRFAEGRLCELQLAEGRSPPSNPLLRPRLRPNL